jgi:NADH dehydrogenase (ubiquinone) Fe-S protein 3
MAMKVPNRRALSSALSSTKTALIRRNDSSIRCFTSTQNARVIVSQDNTPNMRSARRDPVVQGSLRAAPVNPADKYAAKADDMHKYGQWLMGCLPKYIQQFSVWKDELVIYIPPSGVIPVFNFLKCRYSVCLYSSTHKVDNCQTIRPQSSPRYLILPPLISPPETSDSKLCTIC